MIIKLALIFACSIAIVLLYLLEKTKKELSEYKKLFPFGEVVDRITINSIKQSVKTGKFEKKEVDLTHPFLDRVIFSSQTMMESIFGLLLLNMKQWKLEDEVREKESPEAAFAARKNNTERVKVKNIINDLVGDQKEEKFYKGENNDK